MNMNSVHLKISNVSKSFGDVQALRNVSLNIPKGSFTTFLGPSGCGKTTMLRTIAGFYDVDQGEIHIGDRLINQVPSHKRNAIMVFQDYALFPHMNIGENIAYGLKLQKLSDNEITAKVEKTMQYLGIQGLEKRIPGQISGGQQQRVALARALIMEPEVLLLDEPLSNLDAKLRMNIRAELRQLQKRLGITTIYVTHDQGEALALSDQIAVMDKGRIVQTGSPWEIYYTPVNTFVADFVGTANLLEGTVISKDSGSLRVAIDEIELRIDESNETLAPNDAMTVCIRPETIEILDTIQDNPINTVKGEVLNYIFEGSHIRYWIKVGTRTFMVDVFDPSEKGIYTGEIFLRFHPGKIHILREE
ncbi:MAG: ABC transporter ATP-binding protein [Candidatus Vecturithrix sp.]|jgi:ABC-type Fe3+/spermidine/putrescine transport system ATPase subunit|nr:ABC transporter ATP-binding protein [Candidatus Vecturithrix sp.]